MKKVLIFFAEGYEEVEALTVVDLLRRAGIDAVTVSVTGKKEVTGSHKITTITDMLVDDVEFANADMIVLPGGMPGTPNLEACDKLMAQVDAFALNGKYVAAICAAPGILGRRGLLIKRSACIFPGMDEELKGGYPTGEAVCTDGNIITSRGVGTAIPFALKLVELLIDKETAKNLSRKIVYK